jgi:hypothetical protein
MHPIFDRELFAAMLARPLGGLPPILTSAMRVESRGAIGADNSKVLYPIVVGNSIYVVEDQ